MESTFFEFTSLSRQTDIFSAFGSTTNDSRKVLIFTGFDSVLVGVFLGFFFIGDGFDPKENSLSMESTVPIVEPKRAFADSDYVSSHSKILLRKYSSITLQNYCVVSLCITVVVNFIVKAVKFELIR